MEFLREKGVDVELDRLPLDDRATYEMLGRAETVGVFQLEGQGMRDALRQLRPDSIEDIIALVSLYRPGPMDNIPQFCNRKHGTEEIDYLHPLLEPVLRETYGVIIYQEQVMQIARILADYSLGEADLLRRAMGKKIKKEMDAQRGRFVSGALGKGLSEGKASEIFELVARFAGYGFNKSHAAAYAFVAYQTAWMKANHPVEFLAASMNLDMGNPDKLHVFRQELERLGIALLPPDINRSRAGFTVERCTRTGTAAVRYALAAVRNVGELAMSTLVAERDRTGPFEDLFDLAARLDLRAVNKKMIESLAGAGAFDCLDADRAKIVAGAELLIHHGAATGRDRESGQSSLFSDAALPVPPPQLKETVPWSPSDILKAEADAIGFHLSAHPLEAYRDLLGRFGVTSFADAYAQAEARGEDTFVFAAMPVSRRERRNGKGQRFAFAAMSDLSGNQELILFSDLLATSRAMLDGHKLLLIDADARVDDGKVRFAARRLRLLDEAAAAHCKAFEVHASDALKLERLRHVLDRAESGQGRMTIAYPNGDGDIVHVELPEHYALSPGLRAQIEALPGVLSVLEGDASAA